MARWFTAVLLLLPLVVMGSIALPPVVDHGGVAWSALLVAAGLYGLHRWLSYAENRGWIYYRQGRGSSGALAATSEWLTMYAPSRRHVLEARKESEWKRDEDDDGDRRTADNGEP